MEAGTYHTPVLSQEVISYLLTSKNNTYVDGTLGGGGHTKAIIENLGVEGKVIGIDLDKDAVEEAGRRLASYGDRIIIIKDNFMNIRSVLKKCGIESIQGILLDLGVSSFQIDEPSKGFSFLSDGKLDMRMNRDQEIDAKSIVNHYGERALADIIWRYGEEKNSRRIAKAIIQHRSRKPVETTGQLSEIISAAIKSRFINKTLARVFQAIRIEVNKELDSLNIALHSCIEALYPGGRIVVISYHSLEDRCVKDFFRESSMLFRPSGNKLIPDTPIRPALKVLTTRPVTASENEISENPRSRSAKLRAAEKL